MTSVGKKCIYIYSGNIVIWQTWHWDAVNFNFLGDGIGRECVNWTMDQGRLSVHLSYVKTENINAMLNYKLTFSRGPLLCAKAINCVYCRPFTLCHGSHLYLPCAMVITWVSTADSSTLWQGTHLYLLQTLYLVPWWLHVYCRPFTLGLWQLHASTAMSITCICCRSFILCCGSRVCLLQTTYFILWHSLVSML